MFSKVKGPRSRPTTKVMPSRSSGKRKWRSYGTRRAGGYKTRAAVSVAPSRNATTALLGWTLAGNAADWLLGEDDGWELLPNNAHCCPLTLEVEDSRSKPTRRELASGELPVGGAYVCRDSDNACPYITLNTGCYVSCSAFCPTTTDPDVPDGMPQPTKGGTRQEEEEKQQQQQKQQQKQQQQQQQQKKQQEEQQQDEELRGVTILALGVHSRLRPVCRSTRYAKGLAGIQFWALDNRTGAATLKMILAHDGHSTKSIKWVHPSRTPDRLGLLGAVLGDGCLKIFAIPMAPFRSFGGGEAPIITRLPPLWSAPTTHPSAFPAPDWDRRVCSIDLKAGEKKGSLWVLGGCSRSTILFWKLENDAPKPDGPQIVFYSHTAEVAATRSLAWAPYRDRYCFAAGLSNGYVLLWDVRSPAAPIFSHFTQVHSPILDVVWVSATRVCVRQNESMVVDLSVGSSVRMRPGMNRKLVGLGMNCSGVSKSPFGVLSAWVDGILCLNPLRVRRLQHQTKGITIPLLCWTFVDEQALPYRQCLEERQLTEHVGSSSEGESTSEEEEADDSDMLAPAEGPSTEAWDAAMDDTGPVGEMSRERRRALSRAHLSLQSNKVTALRRWETDEGKTRLRLTVYGNGGILEGDDLRNATNEVPNLVAMSSAVKLPEEARLPISSIATTRPFPKRSPGKHDLSPLLIATSTAAGIVLITRMQRK